MIRTGNILLAMAILATGLGLILAMKGGAEAPPAAEAEPSPRRELIADVPHDDLFIHPLCLDRAEELGRGAGFWCEQEVADVEVTALRTDYGTWFRAERPPPAPDIARAGHVTYRVARRWTADDEPETERVLLEVSDNGGGSGHFARLDLLERRADRGYRVVDQVYGGDRCNGGYMRVVSMDETSIVYKTAATPFRLLNPSDRTDGRAAALRALMTGEEGNEPTTLLGWRAATEVSDCAQCCAGSIINRGDIVARTTELVGVELDPEPFRAASRVTDIQTCLDAWSEGLPWKPHRPIELGDWASDLAELESSCAD